MSQRLKAVFFGTPDFALPSLQAALATTDILAVVTQPDRPRGRGQKVLPCGVKALALEGGLRCFSPSSLRKSSPELDELLSFLDAHSPDLFLVTAYGNILPESFLARPRLGAINVHASLLPRWRGAAPIQRALEAGDAVSGVCLQKMVYELDAGDVLAAEEHPLPSSTDAFEATGALSRLGGLLLARYLGDLNGGPLLGQPQNSSKITHAAKIRKEEGLWSPDWSAIESHNRIRAFCVWPSVRARFPAGNHELKLLRSTIAPAPRLLSPGELMLQDGRVFCGVRTSEAAGSDCLELLRIQAPGKAPVAAFDYFQNFGKQSKLEKV